MKQSLRTLAALLAAVLLLGCFSGVLAADVPQDIGRSTERLKGFQAETFQRRNPNAYGPDDEVRAIVVMKAAPLAEQKSLISRLFSGESRLLRQHQAVMQTMTQEKINYKLNFEYTTLLNGMSLTVRYGDLDSIAAMPGVDAVYIANHYDIPRPVPQANSAGEMVDAFWLRDSLSGDGSGTVIAVLDTGVTLQHESVQVWPDMLQTPAYTKTDMLERISELGHGAYYSQKIPYQYDYADHDSSAYDDAGGHGTHVAGIAAGYACAEDGAITFSGSAPDAQILAMKIFSAGSRGTSSDIYYAALEDAYRLGADVINMSLGADNGFTYDEDLETEVYGNIFRRLNDAGIQVCASAGNAGTMADIARTRAGEGYVTPDYTDYGVLGTPASYDGNTAVAAVDNAMIPSYTIRVAGEDHPYRDSNGTAFASKFGGQTVEYVPVPGLGEVADYENIDVVDKIALVQRGIISFEAKVSTAAAAGASGIIVYNNSDDGLMGMSVTTTSIPSVFVTKEVGEQMLAQAERTISVSKTEGPAVNPTGWSVSYFSSRGSTNDLQIKPQISGVGGTVNSAKVDTVNGYVINSGTSMSCPNVAGSYAALTEVLRARYPDLSKPEIAAMVEAMAESTATILKNGSIAASPRAQGAGLINLRAAASASAYLLDPLCELGDDKDETGVFTAQFTVQNLTDAPVSYAISATVLTDAVEQVNIGTEDAPELRSYNPLTGRDVTEQCSVSSDAPDDRLTLSAGESRDVTVTIRLSDALRAELSEQFENGTYVEGFIRLANETEALHATFLGFYGDWEAAPIMEQHDYREVMDLVNTSNLSDYQEHVDWDINTDISLAFLCDSEGNPVAYAGDNLFGNSSDIHFSDKRIAVSTNNAVAYATAIELVPTVIRNARHVIMVASDADTGEIYNVDDTPYCAKTIYDPEYEMWTSSCSFYFDGIQDDGRSVIPSNTRVNLDFYANLPYGEDVLGNLDASELKTKAAQYLQWSIPCTVDSEAPQITEWNYDYKTGDVELTVAENQYLAGVSVVDLKQQTIAQQLFGDDEPGQSHHVRLHIGRQRNFFLVCQDYASNETREHVSAVIDPTTLTYLTPEGVSVNSSKTSVTVSKGDQIVLPGVTGEIEGYEFAQWSQTPIPGSQDPALAISERAGAKFVVHHDTELSAVFRRPDGVFPATEKVGRVLSDAEDWSGTYAVGGTDWIGYAFYVLAADGKTVPTRDRGITVTNDAILNHVPSDCLFTLAKQSDGSYTVRGTSGFLALDAKAANGLAVLSSDASAAARWDVSFFEGDDAVGQVRCVRLVSRADASMRLLLDTEKGVVECRKADDSVYCDDALLYLYGAVDRYFYTTNPQPFHDWSAWQVTTPATEDAEGVETRVCKNDASHTETRAIPKLEPAVTPSPTPTVEPTAQPEKCDGGEKCPSKVFTDVDRSAKSWSHEAIDWAVTEKITNGTAADKFGPGEGCTRAQAVTFLWRAAGEPEPTKTDNPFTDVKADAYYYKAVLWAVEKEITNGTAADKFSPDAKCTRGQIVTFLWRNAGQPVAKAASAFTDVEASAYYAPAVSWAVENGITNGTSATTFAPNDACTRAHIVTFLWRNLK